MPYRPKDVLRVLKRLGFVEARQRGSHVFMKHPDGRATALPMHNKDMRKGLFHSILDDIRLTEAQFRKLV